MNEEYEPSPWDPELMDDPRGVFGRLREETAMRRGRTMDGSPIWYVTRAEDVRAVLNDRRFVTTLAPEPGAQTQRETLLKGLGLSGELASYAMDTLPDLDGEDHDRLRKLVAAPFTGRAVADLRPRVEQVTEALLDDLEAAGPGPVNLMEHFVQPLPITVICELVGVPEEDRPSWRRLGNALVKMVPEGFADTLQAMVDSVRSLLELKRREPADDMVSEMLRAQAEGGDSLSDHELIKMVITLVNTGHETLSQLIGNSVLALLTNPEQLDILRNEPARWPVAVHELIRMCSPVRYTAPRFATKDLEVAGVPIAVGEGVQPVLVSANLDPREHPDADRFDVTRRDGGGEGHIGFGQGVHRCLGATLARQEVEVSLSALFTRFPNLKLDGEPQYVPGPLLGQVVSLPVSLGR